LQGESSSRTLRRTREDRPVSQRKEKEKVRSRPSQKRKEEMSSKKQLGEMRERTASRIIRDSPTKIGPCQKRGDRQGETHSMEKVGLGLKKTRRTLEISEKSIERRLPKARDCLAKKKDQTTTISRGHSTNQAGPNESEERDHKDIHSPHLGESR